MPAGPCQGCGAVNYPNSLGGPSICPSCDCGFPPRRDPPPWTLVVDDLLQQRDAEIEMLRQQVAALVLQVTIPEGLSGGALPAFIARITAERDAALSDAAALRTALTTFAEWHGGPDHHRDDCPEAESGGCEECLMCANVDAALVGAT